MTRTLDPITPCKRGCCWNPFFGTCATKRQCTCHTADPVIPWQEPPISRVTYQDHTAGRALSNVMRAQGQRR